MKSSFLIPNRYRIILGLLSAVFFALWIATAFYDFMIPGLNYPVTKDSMIDLSNNNFSDEIALIGLIASLLAFSLTAERIEDEYVRNVRLRSLQAAFCSSYLILIAVVAFVYGSTFLLMVYLNMFTTLILFLIIYYLRLHIIPRLQKPRTAL